MNESSDISTVATGTKVARELKQNPKLQESWADFQSLSADQRTRIMYHDSTCLITPLLGVLQVIEDDKGPVHDITSKLFDTVNGPRSLEQQKKILDLLNRLPTDLAASPEQLDDDRRVFFPIVAKALSQLNFLKTAYRAIVAEMSFLQNPNPKDVAELLAINFKLSLFQKHRDFKIEPTGLGEMVLNGADFISLMNALNNAVRFTEDFNKKHQSEERVTVTKEGDYLIVTNPSDHALPDDFGKPGAMNGDVLSNTGYGVTIAKLFQRIQGREYEGITQGQPDGSNKIMIKIGPLKTDVKN